MNKNQYALTLDSEAFNGLKNDFKMLLNSTINTMLQKEVDAAAMSIKIEITLTDGFTHDYKVSGYDADREITTPQFKHKITTTMQLKDEKSGSLGGDGYELVWDKDAGAFVLRSTDMQTSLFGDQPPASDPLALPPSEDVVDVEFTEADGEDGGDEDGYDYDEPTEDGTDEDELEDH